MYEVAAVITAVGGLGMIAFSFLPWLRFSESAPGAPDAVVDFLSGWGGTLPDGTAYGDLRPAAWTVVVGAVLAVIGLVLWLLRGSDSAARFPVAIAGSIVAAAGLAIVSWFLSNPQAAFGIDGGTLLAPMLTVERGIWVVFLGVVMALFGAVSAAGLTRSRQPESQLS